MTLLMNLGLAWSYSRLIIQYSSTIDVTSISRTVSAMLMYADT